MHKHLAIFNPLAVNCKATILYKKLSLLKTTQLVEILTAELELPSKPA